jgi:hypothetical protein
VVFALARTDALPVGGAGRTRLREVFVYVVVWIEGKISSVRVYPGVEEASAAAELLAEERA